MEGCLYIPPTRAHRAPELTCSECGASFRPRHVGEGFEELCDACYDKRFASAGRPERKPSRRLHAHKLAAD